MPSHIDITGMKFGKLTAVNKIKKNGLYFMECKCDCGNIKVISAKALTRSSKPTRSCGCILTAIRHQKGSAANSFTHGHAINGRRSRILVIWSGMIDRCANIKNKKYSDYGGRGIKVTDDWLIFENFLSDMGEPKPGYSLDRKDNNFGYNKNNCRWATQKEQTRNARSNRVIEFNGKTQVLSEWCEELGLSYYTVHSRISKLKWSIDKSFTTPARPTSRRM